jgi:heme/copper-type cytochrome/quinol oxidase subunit 4
MKTLQTRPQVIGILALAALVLAVIFTVAPAATVMTNAASTEVYGVDVLGLTKNAKDLPVEQYVAY